MIVTSVGTGAAGMTVGELGGGGPGSERPIMSEIKNAAKIVHSLDRAREMHVDVLLFPELTLTGYPPEDLLLKPRFVRAAR